jgi:hypothetical protein
LFTFTPEFLRFTSASPSTTQKALKLRQIISPFKHIKHVEITSDRSSPPPG